jgi:hypothetical protein
MESLATLSGAMTHRHKRTGNLYHLVAEGRDCTNAHGRLVPVAIYRNSAGWWVRDLEEFNRNFEPLKGE